MICPSRRIRAQAFRACLNEILFQLVQLWASHENDSRFRGAGFMECTPTILALFAVRLSPRLLLDTNPALRGHPACGDVRTASKPAFALLHPPGRCSNASAFNFNSLSRSSQAIMLLSALLRGSNAESHRAGPGCARPMFYC